MSSCACGNLSNTQLSNHICNIELPNDNSNNSNCNSVKEKFVDNPVR